MPPNPHYTESLRRLMVGNVREVRLRPAACRRDFVHNLLSRRIVSARPVHVRAQVVDDNRGTLSRHHPRHRSTNPPPSARNHRNPPVQLTHDKTSNPPNQCRRL